MHEKKVPTYKAVADGGGFRFLFYCDVSGAHVCTTKELYFAPSEEEALFSAWKTEGEGHFNRCHRCGRWVIDAAYNAEVLECVECAPYEAEPKFCKFCGQKIETKNKSCPNCGRKLRYEGGTNVDDTEGQI